MMNQANHGPLARARAMEAQGKVQANRSMTRTNAALAQTYAILGDYPQASMYLAGVVAYGLAQLAGAVR